GGPGARHLHPAGRRRRAGRRFHVYRRPARHTPDHRCACGLERLQHPLDREAGPSMRLRPGTRRASSGFTLVELLITITLLALLLGLAVPFFGGMIRNTRVRSVSEALQNGVRTAQAEAVRRNRQVVFFLTNAEPALNAPAAANGRFWAIQTVPQALDASETAAFVQG